MCFCCVLYQILEAVLGEWLYRYRQLAIENRFRKWSQTASHGQTFEAGTTNDDDAWVINKWDYLTPEVQNLFVHRSTFKATSCAGTSGATFWYTGIMNFNQMLPPWSPFERKTVARSFYDQNRYSTGSNQSSKVMAPNDVPTTNALITVQNRCSIDTAAETYTILLDRISRYIYPLAVIVFSLSYWPQMLYEL